MRGIEVMEYVLMAVLILAALFLIVAVLLQKTKEDGLSSTIVGNTTETYYGKEKSGRRDVLLHKITIVCTVVFMLAVLVIYIIQPDYSYTSNAEYWKSLSSYGSTLFK